MMNNKLVLWIFVLFLLVCTVVAQGPPITETFVGDRGYDIQTPFITVLELSKDFFFHFHIFNLSNGLIIDNSSTSCSFHLYNNTGEHILEDEVIDFDPPIDFEIFVQGGNFSRIGIYSYIINCNDTVSALGGFREVQLEVVENLSERLNSDIFYIIFTYIFLIIFYTFFGMIVESTTIKFVFFSNAFLNILNILWIIYLNHSLASFQIVLMTSAIINLIFLSFVILYAIFKFFFGIIVNPKGLKPKEEIMMEDFTMFQFGGEEKGKKREWR